MVLGQFLEIGIERINLTVNPILVNAFEIVAKQTTIPCSSLSLIARPSNVMSGRSSTHPASAASLLDVIFDWYCLLICKVTGPSETSTRRMIE
jgi:hypothetical protein